MGRPAFFRLQGESMHIIKKGETRADQCFEVIEIVCYPIGGGKQLRIRPDRIDEFEVFDPYAAEHMLWIPGFFSIDEAEVRGFHKRQSWNGFACPVLLEEDLPKIAASWNTPAVEGDQHTGDVLEKRGDTWWFKDQSEGVWDPCTFFEVEHLGKTYECWDIGTLSLCWQAREYNWVALEGVEEA